MNHDLLLRFIDLLFKLVELVIFPLLALAIGKYVKDSRARAALSTLNEQALLAVQRLNRTRRELKDPSRPGQWTDAEAQALKDAAKREVKQALGDTLESLITRYGSELEVDQLIGRAIDAHAEKTRSAASPTPSITPPPPTPSQPPQPSPSQPPQSSPSPEAGDNAATPSGSEG